MALAEKQVGASFNAKDSFFVEVHNGVSAGLIINNQLLSGIGVGEMGHIQVDSLGKLCTCGHYGCLETVISNTAIVAHYAERTDQQSNEPLSIQHVIEQALAFDENAIAVLKKAMAHLGTAIANMINVFRPETIIIAGEITQAWSIIEPVLNQQISTKSLQIEGFEHIPIVRSDLYDSPWYSGYALVREALLGGELLPNLLLEDSPAESVSND
jgi:N-acetylglucosamine repressor